MVFPYLAISLFESPQMTLLAQLQPVWSAEPSPSLLAQLLTTLAVGLLTAFGFQLLLTNLGIALGISVLAVSAFSEPDSEAADGAENTSSVNLAGWLGPAILVTVNVVLFAACFLAARFSQVGDPLAGAIAGLTIWSAYLLILIWLSTKTLNSVAGFIFDWTTGGLRRLVSVIAAALEPAEVEPLSEAQMLESVRQEVRSALDSAELRSLIAAQLQTLTWQAAAAVPETTTANGRSLGSAAPPPPVLVDADFWQPIQTYLAETNSKSLTPKRLNRRLQQLLQSAYDELPAEAAMPPLPVELLVEGVSQREDLSDKKKQRILAQIEATRADFYAELELPSHAADSPETETETQSSSGFDPSAISQDLLRSAAETALKQVFSNLPDLLQKVKPDLPYGLGLASVVLAEALPDLQPESLLDALPVEAADVRQYVDHLLDETQGQMAQLGQASLQQAEHLRELALKPVERVQQGVQARLDALKQQAREQAEATRKAAATAAWWLFATASTGAISAALAGALATEWLWPFG